MLKVLKFLFLGKTFVKRTYTYTFLNVSEDKDGGLYYFDINCTLPEPNQGYVLEKMKDDCREIIEKFYSYIGQKISISYNLLLDGKEPLGVYLPYQKVQKILEGVNKNFRSKTLLLPYSNELKIKMSFYYKKNPYYLDGEEISFKFYTEIREWVFNNKLVDVNKLNSSALKNLYTTLYDKILESDLQMDIEGIIYRVTEPDFQISEIDDLYLNAIIVLEQARNLSYDFGDYLDEESMVELFNSL